MRAWLILLLLCVPAVAAHASLSSMEPPAGSRLDAPPAEIRIRFTEPVDSAGTEIRVLDVTDHRVDNNDLAIASDRLSGRVTLKPNLPEGPYVVEWQTLSRTDGHTIRGSVGFAIGAYDAPASQGNDGKADPTNVASRGLWFAGLALVLGAVLFAAYLGHDEVLRRFLVPGTLLAAGGTLLLIMGSLRQTGLPFAVFASTDVGRILVTRMILVLGAVLIAALATRRPTRSAPWATLGLMLLAGLGASRLGHASLQGPVFVALDFLHLMATTLWAGALVVFLWTLKRPGVDVVHMGRRFGTVAMAAVMVLWATGLILSVSLTGIGWHVIASPWGNVLALKVLLATAMVTIAAVNRYAILEPPATGWKGRLQAVTSKLSRNRIRSWTLFPKPDGLRKLLAIEAGLGLVTLVLAALLTSISPPVAPATDLELTASGTEFTARIHVEPLPTQGASSDLFIQLDYLDGTPLEPTVQCGRDACVRLVIVGPTGNETRDAVPSGDGWRVTDVLWARAGSHVLEWTVSSDRVYSDTLRTSLSVTPNASFK